MLHVLSHASCLLNNAAFYYCSPYYQLFFGVYILPVHHVLLTCHRVALSLVQNQYSHHDFKVYVSALFATWSVVLPHPPLRNTYTYHSKYHIVYEFFNKITGIVAYYVLAILRFSTSGSLCVPLHRCDGPLVLSSGLDRLLVPTGGGR